MSLKALVLPAAALVSLFACSSSNSGGGCPTLVLSTTADVQMSIDAAPTASVPFSDWQGTLQMDGLPAGVGFAGHLFVGSPTQTGTFVVHAQGSDNGCESNVVTFNVVVADRPADCAGISDCACVGPGAIDSDGVACTSSKDCASTARPTCAKLQTGSAFCCGDDSASATVCGGSVVNVTEKSAEGSPYDVCGNPNAICNERQHCVVQTPSGG